MTLICQKGRTTVRIAQDTTSVEKNSINFNDNGRDN